MQTTYLNTASCGIIDPQNTAIANELYAGLSGIASRRAEKWRDEEQPVIRKNVAVFLDVPAVNVALIPNFSWAMNGIVHSLKGDEKIMLYAGDYPSVLDPFNINNFDTTWISAKDGFGIDNTELKQELLSQQIDILCVSHVQWSSGFKLDLGDIGAFCKEHDIWFIVDATQSLGAIEIKPVQQHIDVLIASNYKWMNAGFGTGVMYMNDDFLQAYPPKVGGHNSYTFRDGKPTYISGITSYEPGHPNMYGLTLLNASILHRMEQGVANIELHNRDLTQLLLDSIRELNVTLIGDWSVQNRASMIFLRDENGLSTLMKKNGIVATYRGSDIRISMHYYNTADDIATLVRVLKDM